jgi:hypothetical protein
LIAADGSLHPSSLPTHRFDSDVVPEMSAVFIVTREEGKVRVFFGEDGGSFRVDLHPIFRLLPSP